MGSVSAAIALALGSLLLAAPSGAITVFAQQACVPGSANFAPGWADSIDATPPDTNNSGAPYNLDFADDAVVCVDQFNAANNIANGNTAAFQNELANVGSHEQGHLLGLEHADGGVATIMTVVFPFSGVNRGFTSPAEQQVLNDNPNVTQVVWLDFEAAQPGLFGFFEPWYFSPELANHGIVGAAAIAAAQAAVVSQIVADYSAMAWTGGLMLEFYTTQADAQIAALNAGLGPDAYSTVSFVAVPEPRTLVLILGGLLALGARARRRAA